MTNNLDRYARALIAVSDQRHVEICLDPEVAWSLLRMAQRACQFQSPEAKYLREGAIAIQQAIAPSGPLGQCAAMGWSPEAENWIPEVD